MTSAQDGRSDEEVAMERAATEVSEVLLNPEHTIARARRAAKTVSKDGVDTNAELALGDLVPELDRLRKRLQQDTYFAGNAIRLI